TRNLLVGPCHQPVGLFDPFPGVTERGKLSVTGRCDEGLIWRLSVSVGRPRPASAVQWASERWSGQRGRRATTALRAVAEAPEFVANTREERPRPAATATLAGRCRTATTRREVA